MEMADPPRGVIHSGVDYTNIIHKQAAHLPPICNLSFSIAATI